MRPGIFNVAQARSAASTGTPSSIASAMQVLSGLVASVFTESPSATRQSGVSLAAEPLGERRPGRNCAGDSHGITAARRRRPHFAVLAFEVGGDPGRRGGPGGIEAVEGRPVPEDAEGVRAEAVAAWPGERLGGGGGDGRIDGVAPSFQIIRRPAWAARGWEVATTLRPNIGIRTVESAWPQVKGVKALSSGSPRRAGGGRRGRSCWSRRGAAPPRTRPGGGVDRRGHGP